MVPPALLTPVANAPVKTTPRYENGTSVIEIMVNEDGFVQSVKTVRDPATMGEALDLINWLSITKSWRFGPATRNGEPVKYRLLVPLRTLLTWRSIR